jgi:FkbM family methyltransferase
MAIRNDALSMQPIRAKAEDLERFEAGNNFYFRATQAAVNLLPRGKVSVARWLGNIFPARGVTKTATGVSLAIDDSNIDFFGELVKHGGTWEDDVRNTCIQLLSPGDVFYDIGANAGFVSLEIGKHFSDTVHVLSFEPQPRLAYNIAISAGLNGLSHLDVYDPMLGSEDGEGELFLAKFSIHASAISRQTKARSIRCQKTTLDYLVSSGSVPPPNVIKIDVEGGEMDVFKGARNTIEKAKPSIVFEADDNCSRFGYSRQELFEFLRSLVPYEIYFLDRGAKLISVDEDPNNINPNLVAIPPENESRQRAKRSPPGDEEIH